MTTIQVQGSEPVQVPKVLFRHESPSQHAAVGEHACPPAEQVAPDWQVPDEAPVGNSQRRPAQQSEPEVQAVP